MSLEIFIFPYWLLFAFVIGRAIYIRKFHLIPTLKKYGGDYEDYISPSKQKKQLEEYIKVCQENNLPSKYWRYLKRANTLALFLVAGWFLLLYMAKQ